MSFLHGVETIESVAGNLPVKIASTSIIGLVGLAPKGPKNVLTRVDSPQEAEQFGGELYPLTINRSLQAIFRHTRATVLVVNVFDPATHKTDVVEEATTVTNGKASVDSVVLLAPTAPVVKDNAAAVTYVEGDDYTITEYGVITIIPGGDISEGDTLKVNYSKPNTTGITGSDFIGVAGPPRTGFKLFQEAFDTFGFNPKIFICPEYSSQETVAVEMASQSATFRATCYVDGPNNTAVDTLVSNRTTSGTSFNVSNRRVTLVGPWIQAYNHKEALSDLPLSPIAAAITAQTDNEEGYWVSPSNHWIQGISGPEFAMLGTGINDASSDANSLNAAGIMTVLKSGTGYKLWGNRNSSWPNDTDPRNFIPVTRVRDIVHESLEKAKEPFLDKPIIQATIDAIRASGNGFVRTLIQRGALLPGSEVIYDPADNPASELALGHLTLRLVSMAPTPAERITYNSVMDINLLTNLS